MRGRCRHGGQVHRRRCGSRNSTWSARCWNAPRTTCSPPNPTRSPHGVLAPRKPPTATTIHAAAGRFAGGHLVDHATALRPAAVRAAAVRAELKERRRSRAGQGTGRATAAAAAVQRMRGPASSMDQATRRLLLRVPARRAARSTSMQRVRQPHGLLQPGPLHRVPSQEPGPSRLLPTLPGVGRLPPATTGRATRADGGSCTIPQWPATTAAESFRSGSWAPVGCAWNGRTSPRSPGAPSMSWLRPPTASSSSWPTWRSTSAARRGSNRCPARARAAQRTGAGTSATRTSCAIRLAPDSTMRPTSS